MPSVTGFASGSKSNIPGIKPQWGLYVGQHGHDGNNRFNGQIDEVAVWNKALTNSEISALYNSGSGLDASSDSVNYASSSSLQGYWNLNENSGVTATDLSGNNNHGTLTNGPTRVPGTGGSVPTTRTLTITDPNTTSYEIAYDLTDTTVDFSGQGLALKLIPVMPQP